MSSAYSHSELITLLKRSLQTIQQLKEQNTNAVPEPIAIIGMACRFPGGCDTPEKFWDFLAAGKEAVSEVPVERFNVSDFYDPNPEQAGKTYTKYGNFLNNDLAQFDAQFFGISPREATELDPQQRLLLELSWEALERAGYAPLDLKNSNTGTFIGLILSEYSFGNQSTQAINPYTLTGVLPNLASGRIAHFFGFHGPALTVDTACSSSLVSTHLACESLKNHECDLALAGGASLMVSPEAFVMLSKVRALSPDGRCKAFDASADGYGRGEGGGIIVLKRLSDALRDNDKILAVINATSVNQDGPSSGLTVPNGLAQQALIQSTLNKAKLTAQAVSYIEAHGTGTPLGDPIETQALTAVFGQDKRPTPLQIGTVKANIGHLEAAAGIASIIKTVLCLQNNCIPAHRYVNNINPRINLAAIPATLAANNQTWERANQSRYASISSFGFSGTNAHCIISDAPIASKPAAVLSQENKPQVFTLSAYNEAALSDLIGRYRHDLNQQSNYHFTSLCANANRSRTQFPYRVAYIAQHVDELKKLLDEDFKQHHPAIYYGHQLESYPDIAFFFQANLQLNYSKALSFYQQYSAFQKAWAECESVLEHKFGHNRLGDAHPSPLQPYHVFAFNYALAKLWLFWGVTPSAVLGEQAGIYVAACIAGVMSLETALTKLLHDMQAMPALEANDLSPPHLSILDSKTGEWLKKSTCLEPTVWSNALNQAANLPACLQALQARNILWTLHLGTSESTAAHSMAMPINYDELNQILAKLWCSGININWTAFYADTPVEKLILPTYPFQRKVYWHAKLAENATEIKLSQNPLFPEAVNTPLAEKLMRFCISPTNLPTLADTLHIMHVGYFIEMLNNSINQHFLTPNFFLKSITFRAPLIASADKPATIWLIFRAITDEGCDFEFFTEDKESNSFRSHVTGSIDLSHQLNPCEIDKLNEEKFKDQALWQLDAVDFYQGLESRGAKLGKSVQWVEKTWSVPFETLAQFAQFSDAKIPNGIWDACAQLFHAALLQEPPSDKLYMVNEWRNVYYDPKEAVESPLYCHVVIDKEDSSANLHGSFTLFSATGKIYAQCERFTMTALHASLLQTEFSSEKGGQQKEFLEQIKNTANQGRLSLLSRYLTEKLAELLKIDSQDFELNSPLTQYGIDSIIGMECNSLIFKDLGIRLPTEAFVEHASINSLAEKLVVELSRVLGCVPELADAVDSPVRQPNSSWFSVSDFGSDHQIKLFCFPYGGGGATLYNDWQKHLPNHIVAVPVQLPGRENRIEEQPIDNMTEMIDKLVETFSTIPPGPCAFYGHSFGALIAWRLVCRLSKDKRYQDLIKHLFIAGFSSPSIGPNPWAGLFAQRLKDHGFEQIPSFEELQNCPPEKLTLFTEAAEFKFNILSFTETAQDLQFIRLLIAKLLCDMKVVTSYRFDPAEVPLAIPITAFAGTDDDRCTSDSLLAWRSLTSGQFSHYNVPGDHFFLHKNQSQRIVIDLICQELMGGHNE